MRRFCIRWNRRRSGIRAGFRVCDTVEDFEIILTIPSPFDMLTILEVRRSLVGLLDFKSSVGG